MPEKEKNDLDVKRSIAEGKRKKDADSKNEMIVIVDDLSLDGELMTKGDKITVTDIQKNRLLSKKPPSIKEVKNV